MCQHFYHTFDLWLVLYRVQSRVWSYCCLPLQNADAFLALWSVSSGGVQYGGQRVLFDKLWGDLERHTKQELRPELKIVFSTK